jgi:PAS domain S-box-containing protein
MRILVVDDHELMRRGICSVLAAEPSLELCGEAVDGQDAIEKTKELHPDIVVMDVSMPRLNGLDSTREIKRLFPDVEVVIVSQHEAPEMMRQAFNAGARGYVVKSSISADLLAAIANARNRELFVKSAPASTASRSLDLQEILQRSAAYELALRESEERYRTAAANLAEGLYTLDPEGRVTSLNNSAERMFGWTTAELLGKRMHDVIHYKRPDGSPFPAGECSLLDKVARKGITINQGEDVFIRKDGSLFPVVYSASPMNVGGVTKGVVISFRDDSKRRETEEALRRSERIYRAIGESIDYGVWICDAGGRNIYASPSFLELIGLSQQEYSEFGWSRVLHPDDARKTIEAWQECVRSGSFWEREHRFQRRNGGWHYILSRGAPIHDADGKILCWAGINLDIQKWKESEFALEGRVAERTEELLRARNELRDLSARLLKTQDEERRRIARELHDGVGQLLAAMNMNLAILLPEKSRLREDAAKALNENGTLVDQALRDIRTMSYLLHPPLLDEVGLGSALQWYVGGFSERSGIAVSLEVTPDLGKLPRDVELSLFRIVQECLTNIHRHSGSSTARVRVYVRPGEVCLEVQDSGKGIPGDVYEKISSGESFGLGIRGIRERLRQFGGQLDIRSDAGGTLVCATLPHGERDTSEDEPQPVETPAIESATKPDPPAKISSGAATILCIDDEPAGMFARKLLLESAGHRVLEARSGPEGINLFKLHHVDAVILDYWMSGMKGTEVASHLKELNPAVPIIVLSGLPDFPGETTGVIDEWLLKGNHRPEHLLVTVKALLERRPA